MERFFLIRVIGELRRVMPDFVFQSILRLLPVSFVLSITEIFGLLMVIPVIQIILTPELIHSNPIYSRVYEGLAFSSEIVFVAFFLASVVLIFLMKNAVVYWASLHQTQVTFEVASRLTTLQFKKHLYQPFQSHVKDNTSVLLRKIIEIPYNFTSGIMLPVVQLINEFIIAIIIILAICLFNPLLFLSILLLVTPFLVLYIKIYKRELKHVSDEREKEHSNMFRKGRQSIEGFREILLFDKFKYFVPRFSNSVVHFSKAMAKLYHLNYFSPKIIETLAIICVFGIFVIGMMLNNDMAALASFLVAFSVAAYRLIPSVNKIILCYNNIRSSDFVFDHFRNVDFNPDEERRYSEIHESNQLLSFNTIRFVDVSFSFENERPLLESLNISIDRGEIIGIVGKSGSGKSTFINIFLGLHTPSRGKIFLDDVELNADLLGQWHKTISFVPQNPVLIEGTILENIAFGIPVDRVDERKLQFAISNSGLEEFISELPKGLSNQISDHSLNISGGQRQRIAIARALYHDGRILIFDEATSALDYETEEVLNNSIKKLSSQSYTIIIIAHRTETLKHCNRIYKIANGKISDPIKFSDLV